MAKTVIDVQVNSNLTEVVKQATSVKDILKASSETRIPLAVQAAKQGVSASNQRAGVDNSGDSSKARSVGPGTGAEARDFAKQAQGLGGLVHLYATFAANIYAVSAAFGALSKAMDTSNMIKGLDQLGANSGRALGSVAKQLSLVTEGALSLRDAMTATAQASSGGMTNAGILRLGLVAKQASQALGISMPDAISRLSRGITKIEPELLDELGIMVKIDIASQNYARSIGKSASALTDFEKRQGFANAVLEQGEKKFGAIQIDVNPYDKILASMQNLSQTGLTLINTVLTPLLKLLSSSPAALGLAMAGIASILVKQAIPALGMFRENARLMAEETHKRVVNMVKEQQQAAIESDAIITDQASRAFKAAPANIAKMAQLNKELAENVYGKGVKTSFKKDVLSASNEEIAALRERSAKYISSQDLVFQERGANLARNLDEIQKIRTAHTDIQDKAQEDAEARDNRAFSHQTQLARNLAKLEEQASKRDIVTRVTESAATLGPGVAFQQLRGELNKLEASKMTRFATIVQGSFGIITTSIGTALNAFGAWAAAIGLIIGGLSLLIDWMSANGKQAEKFANSLTVATDATDNMARTLEKISAKDPMEIFSVETTQARATAIQGLSESITTLVSDFTRLQNASNTTDRVIDSLWDSIGKGSADKLSASLSKAIAGAISGMEEGKTKVDAISRLQNILGANVDLTNIKQVNSELRKLSNTQIAGVGVDIDKVLKDVTREAGNTAANLTGVTNSLTELGKLVQTQKLSLAPSDAAGKLGATMLTAASEITKALADPINSMKILNNLVNDSSTLSILSPDVATDLISSKQRIEDLSKAYGKLQGDLIAGEEKLQALKNAGKATERVDTRTGVATVETKEATEIKKANEQIVISSNKVKADMAAAGASLSTRISTDFVNVGLKNLYTSLSAAVSEGGIIAARGYLSTLKEAGMNTAKAEGALRDQEISMQKQILDATYHQARQQQLNTLATEANTLGMRILTNEQELLSTSERVRAKALEEQPKLAVEQESLAQKAKLTAINPKDALKLARGGEFSDKTLSDMSGYMAIMTGYLSNIAKLSGQSAANRITTFAAGERATTQEKQKELSGNTTSNTTRMLELDTLQNISAEYNRNLQLEKADLEIKNLTNNALSERLAIQTNIKILEAGKGYGDEANRLKAIADANKALDDSRNKQVAETTALKLKQLDVDQKGLEAIRVKSATNAAQVLSDTQNLANAKLDQQQSDVEYLSSIGALSAKDATRKTADIALQQQSLQFTKELAALDADRVTKAQAIEDSKTRLLAINPLADTTALMAQENALEASYLRQLGALTQINDTKRTSITLTAEAKALQEAQTTQMEKMVGVTNSLSTVFGTLGENIGKVGEAITNMAQEEETYQLKKMALEKEVAKAKENSDTNPEAYIEAISKQKKAEKDRSDAELTSASKVANSTKKMFSEKTAAYKAFNAIEKSIMAFKLIMQAKELAGELMVTAGAVAGSLTRTAAASTEMGVKAGVAVASQGAGDPYTAFIRIAAMSALMIGVLSTFGGKGGEGGAPAVNMAGMTSADRQETQGTGQAYISGIKADTGGGIFGDSEAKSTSIVDSLEIMRANSIEGLDYDNRMLKALEKLADSVVGAAKSLYSVPGLRAGTNFGTAEGSKGSGGNAFIDTVFAGDPLTKGILSAVFGGGTTSTSKITSAGVAFKGTFSEVMNEVTGSILQYKDILTQFQADGGFLGGGKSSWTELTTETNQLKDTVQTALSDIFKDANQLFLELGTKTGVTATAISDMLSTFDVSMPVDIMGLTGDALVEELNAVIGTKLSDAAAVIFTGFEKFRNFGEDYLATVIRVVDANTKVETSLRSIGVAFGNLGNFDVSEAMVKAAGSLETFAEQAGFFKDNFLSTAEKLAPIQKSVTDQLASLGISTSITKDQFKDLVLAQNISTVAGRNMYQSLMELAPGFNSMIDLTDSLATATTSADSKTFDLNIKLLQAQGKLAEALALTRAKELAALSSSDAAIQSRIYLLQDEAALLTARNSIEVAIYNALGESEKALLITRADELKLLDASLVPSKKYLYALQDEATLKSKLITAYNKESNALKSTVSNITAAIKTLSDYKNNLLIGDSSIASPAEKYQESKRQAAQVAAIASGIATTDAEILAKQDAISKLPNVTGAFLDASKQLYASSEQYTQDFNSVLQLLDSTGASLALQQTDAQRQLDALTTNTTILSVIEDNTATTAEILAQYLTALTAAETARQASAATGSIAAGGAIQAFANGGRPEMGNALVGENGPEVVNFSNPARVYSNKATNDLFSTKELVEEIKSLHKEIAQLRQDQKTQTGHLISSNYDANARAADKVVTATEDASTQAEWVARSAVKIA